MEGPSLYLAKQQLKDFRKKKILEISGNTKIGKERLLGKEVVDIFSWGKHLVFQFDDFAMRIHFLLFGTFSASINGKSVTGDYKKARTSRLTLRFKNGSIEMYNCSIKFIDDKKVKKTYDFSVDIMSSKWDKGKALKQMKENPHEEISDVLLDQNIFAGVGNIESISPKKLSKVAEEARDFSMQFLKWRRKFMVRKNLKAHRKGSCPHCGTKMIREKTGRRDRWAYYCPMCQPIK
jgi:endonuclease VIII